jgi:hypothetical protein
VVFFVEAIFFKSFLSAFKGQSRNRRVTLDMLVQVLQGMALEAPSFKVVEVQFSLKV